jgi:hypothetical protein
MTTARYEQGDVLVLPVTTGKFAVAQIVATMAPAVLLAVFSELYDHAEVGLATLDLDDPIFLAPTVDLYIEQGRWRRLGTRAVSRSISLPSYKVWVEPPGEYRRQDIHGNLGEVLSPAEVRTLPNHVSYSPAAIEAGLQGLHGFGPWYPAFEGLAAR